MFAHWLAVAAALGTAPVSPFALAPGPLPSPRRPAPLSAPQPSSPTSPAVATETETVADSDADVQANYRQLRAQTDEHDLYSARAYAPTGLYPIWEGTGFILPHRHGVVATSDIAMGLGDMAQVGIRPTAFAMRAPNGHVKVRIPSGLDRLSIAAELGVYAFLPGAEDAFYSPSFSTRMQTKQQTYYVMPLSLAISFKALDWLVLHNTLTALGVIVPDPLQDEVTVGDFVTVEVLLHHRHSFFLHGGEIGMWKHDMTITGVSYRYNYEWVELRLGYFYRYDLDGMQRQPLFSVGFII